MTLPVSFASNHLRLAGELHVPSKGAVRPALCICHGIPAVRYNPEDSGYRDLAARCAAAGFVTLLFYFRGAGLSDGDFDMPGWSRDLGAAVGYLAGVREVDASRLFVMGFSGGAAACIHRAARDSRIAGVVSCASPADFDELVGGDRLSSCLARWREIGIVRDPAFPSDPAAWVAGFREVAPVDHVGRLAPRPLLLLHGDADEVVPVVHARRLYDAAGEPRQLAIVPDGLHRLRVDERAMTIALDWLRSHASG